MSEENVEALRRVYGEWGRGNFREGTELYDPHVLLVLRPEFGLASGQGVYCGADEVARYMREVFLPDWEGLVIAGDEFVDAGDSVVVHVHQHGTGRQSHAFGELRYFQVWTFRGTSVIRIESIMERADALEAAGLSAQGLELVHQACDAFNRRDLDAFLALCDPDVEFISYLAQVEGGEPYRGHDGVREWWERLHAVFPDFRAEVEQAQDLGGRTIARWRTHARGVESDALTEQTVWQVGEYRHGKAIEWRFFRSEEEALEAAGLSGRRLLFWTRRGSPPTVWVTKWL